MRSISSLLHGPADLTHIIAVVGERPIELGQFRKDVAANTERLAGSGCRRGLLVTEDTYWAAIGMLSLFQIGAEVILPQNTTPGALAAIREHWDLLLCDRLPEGQPQGFLLRKGDCTGQAPTPLDPAACSLNLFTSGSVGQPKQVLKTLAVMEKEAGAIDEILGDKVPSHARVFGTVTHQHLFGLSYKLFWPLCSGRKIDGAVHDLWESLLGQDLGGAVIVTSPAHLTRLDDMVSLQHDRRPACVVSAGAVLPLAASTDAERVFGQPVCEIYGSTETGTIAWRERGQIDLPWRPLSGVSVKRDTNGTAQVTSPFLPDEEAHHGNDLIEFDATGGFRLCGRNDRIAKIEGQRISLAEVEAQLSALPAVETAALLVLPGEQAVLGAVVVPSESGVRELAVSGAFRFSRMLREALAGHQIAAGKPRRWRFVSALPGNAMGKLLYKDLLALFLSEQRPTEPEVRAIRRGGASVELDLYNSSDLQQLDGHFPGMPIIPGVAQIDWVVKFAARHLDLPIEIAKNYQVKFHRLTLPETMVTLSLSHDSARQRLSFSYHQGPQILTSGFIRILTP